MPPRALNLDAAREQDVFKPPADKTEGKRPPGRPKGSTSKATPKDLRSRLEQTFQRIADSLEGRGDVELASAFHEDGKAMAGGLVSLTDRVRGLRNPLVLLLSLVEPVLAFGRVFRILAVRVAVKRAERAQPPDDPEQAPAGYDLGDAAGAPA